MDEIKERIKVLKDHITSIHLTNYPDNFEEAKHVMLVALRDRIDMLEELNTADYLPTSQRG